VRRAPALLLACALGALIGGCGEAGVSNGATVTAYVAAQLCTGAKRELARDGGQAGDVPVRAVCLSSAEDPGRLNLAQLGANARRATEDSTTVAYLEPADPAANRFTNPILESAGIAWIESDSGVVAMSRLLRTVHGAGSSSLRDSVRESLNEP
jgi:hypothetical protein